MIIITIIFSNLSFNYTGATACIQAPTDDHVFQFTHIEIYGGAHLWVNGTGATVETLRIYGDDTGHFHIGPNQTLELTEVCYFKSNMTET